MTSPVAPTAPGNPPQVPDRSNRTGFPGQMHGFFTWMAGEMLADIASLAGASYTNAVSAHEGATAAAGSATAAAAAVQAATTQAGIALAHAAAAAASAQSALNAPGTNATSTSTLTIDTGIKSLVIQTGKAYSVGQFVVIACTAEPGNYMIGQIIAYDSVTGALEVLVSAIGGTGTWSEWTISLTAVGIRTSNGKLYYFGSM